MNRAIVIVALAAWALTGAAVAAELEQARAHMEAGRTSAALEAVDAVLADSPEDARARFLKGKLLAESGRSDEAVAEFEALVEAFPGLPEAYNNLAVLYAAEGRLAEARDTLEAGLATSDTYATIYENLSSVYVQMARESYARALRLDEGVASPRLAMLDGLPAAEAGSMTAAVGSSAVDGEKADEPRPEMLAAVTSVQEQTMVDVPVGMREFDDAVVRTLEAWARAWSEQDVAAYIDHYADDYAPADIADRDTWVAQRERRLAAPDWIEVSLSDFDVYPLSSEEVTVTVRQEYRSDSYGDVTVKEFRLARDAGAWVIRQEKSLKTLSRR